MRPFEMWLNSQTKQTLKLCAFGSASKTYIIIVFIVFKCTFTECNMNVRSKRNRSFLVKTYIRCDGHIEARPFPLAAEFGPVHVRPIWSQLG